MKFNFNVAIFDFVSCRKDKSPVFCSVSGNKTDSVKIRVSRLSGSSSFSFSCVRALDQVQVNCRSAGFGVRRKHFTARHLPLLKYIQSSTRLRTHLLKRKVGQLKALANEDTLLRTHCCRHKCFPVCPRAQHLLCSVLSGTQKMFLILFRNILCPQQMFPSLRSPRNIMGNNVSATMCPRLPGH